MRKWIFITLLFPVFYATGQPGFNKTYGFEQEQITGSAFANVLLDNDTLVLFGTCYPPVTPFGQQALLFVKMDTLGNVLSHKCHLDPDAPLDEYAAAPNYELIKTSDGGYAMTGSNLATDYGLFIKLSYEGEIEFYRKYDSELERDVRKVLELNDGYFLSGWKQLQNYDTQVFLMKVDKQGNFLWEKTYGQPGVVDVMGSLVKVDDNHFAIGAAKSKGLGEPPYNATDTWTKSWLIQVDSLGNLLVSGESSMNAQAGIVGLNRMPDGWLYGTGTFELINQFQWGTKCKIVRTGENIDDILWERVLSTTTIAGNSVVDIKLTPEGDWVAAGEWITPPPPPPTWGYQFLPSFTYKFTANNDSIWYRQDTIFWESDTLCASPSYVGGLAVMPSGSIVVAGYTDRLCVLPERSYGWVLKISKDGCIDTLCVTTDVNIEPKLPEVIVYPNPTAGILNIIGCDICEAELYDMFGRLVQKQPLNNDFYDLSFLPDGAYWLKILNEDRIIKIKKIIKCR